MKKILSLFVVLVVLSTVVQAQKVMPLDKSPMDRAYYPVNFAHDRKGDDKAVARVSYNRPAKKEREIFGKLVPFDKVWRAGANEATEIKLYQDVTIGGKKLSAGTYSVFTIPNEKEWTVIFNSDLDVWGAYSYNEKNDVLRATATVKKAEGVHEYFTIEFVKGADNEAIMQLVWDTTLVELPIGLK